jgi:hypothetical protein
MGKVVSRRRRAATASFRGSHIRPVLKAESLHPNAKEAEGKQLNSWVLKTDTGNRGGVGDWESEGRFRRRRS